MFHPTIDQPRPEAGGRGDSEAGNPRFPPLKIWTSREFSQTPQPRSRNSWRRRDSWFESSSSVIAWVDPLASCPTLRLFFTLRRPGRSAQFVRWDSSASYRSRAAARHIAIVVSSSPRLNCSASTATTSARSSGLNYRTPTEVRQTWEDHQNIAA